MNCDNPCLQLVATQMDFPDGQERELWRDIWNRAGEHLKFYSSKTRQLVLVKEILKTSAKEVNDDQIKQLVSSVATLILSSEVTENRRNGVPRSWTTLMTHFPENLKVSVSELQSKLDSLNKEKKEINVDQRTINHLEELEKMCKDRLSQDQEEPEAKIRKVSESYIQEEEMTAQLAELDSHIQVEEPSASITESVSEYKCV